MADTRSTLKELLDRIADAAHDNADINQILDDLVTYMRVVNGL